MLRITRRSAACIPPLAGCTGTGSCAGCGGWHGAAEAACGWVCGSAAFAAGRVGHRRLRYHRSVPAGGMAAGPWRGSSRALGCAPARQTEKNRGSLAADSNFLDILQCSEYNIKIGLSGVPGRTERRKLLPAKTAALVPYVKEDFFVKDKKNTPQVLARRALLVLLDAAIVAFSFYFALLLRARRSSGSCLVAA